MEHLGQANIKQMKFNIDWVGKYTKESMKNFQEISENYQGLVYYWFSSNCAKKIDAIH